jgi:hypothetical protein
VGFLRNDLIDVRLESRIGLNELVSQGALDGGLNLGSRTGLHAILGKKAILTLSKTDLVQRGIYRERAGIFLLYDSI